MGIKRHTPEELVAKLRQVEVLCGQRMPPVDAIRQVQTTEPRFYRWRKQYGGMGTDQLKELKRSRRENDRLHRAVSDLTLDKLILSEAARGVMTVRPERAEPMSPSPRWACIIYVRSRLRVSECRACRVLSLDHLWKMDTLKASMPGSATSNSMRMAVYGVS